MKKSCQKTQKLFLNLINNISFPDVLQQEQSKDIIILGKENNWFYGIMIGYMIKTKQNKEYSKFNICMVLLKEINIKTYKIFKKITCGGNSLTGKTSYFVFK